MSSGLDLEIQTANVKMLGRQFDIQPRGQGMGHGEIHSFGSHWHVDVKYFIFK